MQLKKEKILFIINPVSGGRTNIDWEAQIHDHEAMVNLNYQIYKISGKNASHEIKLEIDRFHPDKVIAIGGDGTISMVAKIIMGSPIILGIIPAGSANGMARELEIPVNLKDSLEIIFFGKQIAIDVISINDDLICLHLADLGMNARLIKYFELGKIRGKFGYAKVLLKVLWRKELISVRISSESGVINRKAFMVVIANAKKYGTGAVINPHGDLEDGKFEVIIVRRLALSEILRTILKPGPFNPEKIETLQCSSVDIQCKHAVHFQIDGEYLGKQQTVRAKIGSEKLNVLVSQNFNPANFTS